MIDLLISLIESTIRLSTPLILASLGALVCEKSGVVNIAIEGIMLVGAFSAATVAYYTNSFVLGFLGGAFFSMIFSLTYGVMVIYLKAGMIVSGTAFNLIAQGMTPILSKVFFESATATPSLPIKARAEAMGTYLAFGMTALIYIWLSRIKSGLWLSFAGEDPKILTSAGINVRHVRILALVVSGILIGLAGATLSIQLSSSFTKNMTAGRGFIALATVILGKWRPIPTCLACLFFGAFDAIMISVQGISLIPVSLAQVVPYLLTLLVLSGFLGTARPPSALST